MTKYHCDVCRKEIDPKARPMLHVDIRRGNQALTEQQPEVCEECAAGGFVVFLTKENGVEVAKLSDTFPPKAKGKQ